MLNVVVVSRSFTWMHFIWMHCSNPLGRLWYQVNTQRCACYRSTHSGRFILVTLQRLNKINPDVWHARCSVSRSTARNDTSRRREPACMLQIEVYKKMIPWRELPDNYPDVQIRSTLQRKSWSSRHIKCLRDMIQILEDIKVPRDVSPSTPSNTNVKTTSRANANEMSSLSSILILLQLCQAIFEQEGSPRKSSRLRLREIQTSHHRRVSAPNPPGSARSTLLSRVSTNVSLLVSTSSSTTIWRTPNRRQLQQRS